MIDFKRLEEETIKILIDKLFITEMELKINPNINIYDLAYRLYSYSLNSEDFSKLQSIDRNINKINKFIQKKGNQDLDPLVDNKRCLLLEKSLLLSGSREIENSIINRREAIILSNYLTYSKEEEKKETKKVTMIKKK